MFINEVGVNLFIEVSSLTKLKSTTAYGVIHVRTAAVLLTQGKHNNFL